MYVHIVCMHLFIYVYIYVCMCMYVCICLFVYIYGCITFVCAGEVVHIDFGIVYEQGKGLGTPG